MVLMGLVILSTVGMLMYSEDARNIAMGLMGLIEGEEGIVMQDGVMEDLE